LQKYNLLLVEIVKVVFVVLLKSLNQNWQKQRNSLFFVD